MELGWRHALTGVAILFFVYLLTRLTPISWSRRGRALSSERRKARDRALAAEVPRDKAEAFCEAGELAAKARRWSGASGYFLRAMRADPAWLTPIERATKAFDRKPLLLEAVLWRRLSQIDWEGDQRPTARALATALVAVYDGKLRSHVRADVMRKLAARLG